MRFGYHSHHFSDNTFVSKMAHHNMVCNGKTKRSIRISEMELFLGEDKSTLRAAHELPTTSSYGGRMRLAFHGSDGFTAGSLKHVTDAVYRLQVAPGFGVAFDLGADIAHVGTY